MPNTPVDPGPNASLIGVAGGRGQLQTPALVLDLEALERNIRRMADHVRHTGQQLRPHAKTHKSVEIARRQLAAGAVGVCCATLGEAEVMVAGGIAGVLITSPVVGAGKRKRLAALNERAEGLMVVADDVGNVTALAGAARDSGKPLTVLVDVDVGTKRTGVPSGQAATALARQIANANSLTFGGVQGYGGHLQHIVDFAERQAAAATASAWLQRVVDELTAAGFAPPLVTGGGTGTHDIDHRLGTIGELQCGSYTVMDVDYGRVALHDGDPRSFENALFVAATVVSAVQEGAPITDAGLKAFATDGPLPPIARGAPPGATYGYAGDEHGRIRLPSGQRMAVGDMIECVAPHCDPTVNLFDNYHVVRGDTLVAIWPVDARGKR